MYYILLYIVSHIIWIYRGIPLHKKKRIEVRPGAKLHGRLTKNAYSNSDSSYECLRKSLEQHIGIQQNI